MILTITFELYTMTQWFTQIFDLFFLDLVILGYIIRPIDILLFNAIGHFIIDTIFTVMTRGTDIYD